MVSVRATSMFSLPLSASEVSLFPRFRSVPAAPERDEEGPILLGSRIVWETGERILMSPAFYWDLHSINIQPHL